MEGVKHDEGKLPWDLMPYDALKEVVKVLLFGMKKYSARNWESGIVYSRLYSAAIRHLTAWFQEREDLDPETGLSHLAHASCCILFMLAFVVRGASNFYKNLDDRPGKLPINPTIYSLGWDEELKNEYNNDLTNKALLDTEVEFVSALEYPLPTKGTIIYDPNQDTTYLMLINGEIIDTLVDKIRRV